MKNQMIFQRYEFKYLMDFRQLQAVLAAMAPHMVPDEYSHSSIRNLYPVSYTHLVEMHPFFQQQRNLDTMQAYGVVPEAWGPFNEGRHDFFTNPVLTQIGEQYGKSAAQVALRWNLQRGVVVIPKSVHADRIRQNFEVFDFSLSRDDMEKIKAMDLGHSEIVDHFDPQWIKTLHTLRV